MQNEIKSRRFDGQTVLITGGGSGIGAATAARVAAEGGHPIVLDLNESAARDVAERTGGTAFGGDARDTDLLNRAAQLAIDAHGGLDSLVVSAGYALGGGAEAVEMDAWRDLLSVNLDGALLATKAALPALRAKGGGSIVLVSSIGGILGCPQQIAYGTAKAGMLAMNRSIAIDHGAENIRCNAICPGLTKSAMNDRVFDMLSGMLGMPTERVTKEVVRLSPLKRWAEAEEIAAAIAFLASEDSSFMTGAVLTVDGGISAVEAGITNLVTPPLDPSQ